MTPKAIALGLVLSLPTPFALAQDATPTYADGLTFYDLMTADEQAAIAGDADYVAVVKNAWVRNVTGVGECPDGFRHVSVEATELMSDKFCPLLARWDIARLAGLGSISGPGYNCGIFQEDPRSLGNALCITASFVLDLPEDRSVLWSDAANTCPTGFEMASVADLATGTTMGDDACTADQGSAVASLTDGAFQVEVVLDANNSTSTDVTCTTVSTTETAAYAALAARTAAICKPVATN